MKLSVATSLLGVLSILPAITQSFQVSHTITTTKQEHPFSHFSLKATNDDNTNEEESTSAFVANRRKFISLSSSITAAAMMLQNPSSASAGIDVSGLRSEGGGGGGGLSDQLKSYDGSASRRVSEIKSTQQAASASAPAAVVVPPATAATYAVRSGGLPSLRPIGLGLVTRYEGYVTGPPQSTKLRNIPISFEFPTDWLQLDKISGGVQYVDQRNGDKLYVLRATLPEGTTLSTVPKSFFGDVIFDPKGDIIRFGNVVESYRVSRSQMLDTDCPEGACAPHRRLLLKYDTVTGSGVQTVERRGLVDAYEVDGGEVYMLMTSSNAVKFEAKGKERETVENIVNSFRLGV
mmetsp:Transcript_10849/g.16154  ORF Transcript_10849/g.16154 Transcript_10849/m.16154 type:complete len:348 (-) Transcript_10849:150-1193(-)